MSNNEIENWQTMWQKTKVKGDSGFNEMIKQVYAIEKKEKYEKIVLTVCFFILLIIMVVQPSDIKGSIYYPFVFCLATVVICMKGIPLYKSRIGTNINEGDFTNNDFIQKLRQKTTFNEKDLLLANVLMWLALNGALLGLYEKGTIFNFEFTESLQIILHSLTIPFCLFCYWRKKRELDKNLDTIFSMIKELEESA